MIPGKCSTELSIRLGGVKEYREESKWSSSED